MRKIRKNDEVIVRTGKDKGQRGQVIDVLEERVLVRGVNKVKRHVKANPQKGIAGGILQKEAPIQLSNVAIFNPQSGKADRVGFKLIEAESGAARKVRVYKSTHEVIDG